MRTKSRDQLNLFEDFGSPPVVPPKPTPTPKPVPEYVGETFAQICHLACPTDHLAALMFQIRRDMACLREVNTFPGADFFENRIASYRREFQRLCPQT